MTFSSACRAEIDIVIILDASTSVTETNFKKMLDFCKDFLRNADIDSGSVRVGILIYSTEVNSLLSYGTEKHGDYYKSSNIKI